MGIERLMLFLWLLSLGFTFDLACPSSLHHLLTRVMANFTGRRGMLCYSQHCFSLNWHLIPSHATSHPSDIQQLQHPQTLLREVN